MFNLRHSLLAAILLTVGLAPLTGKAQSFDAEFEFRLTGIPVGTLVTRGGQTGSGYEIRATVKPNRLVGVVTQYAFDGSASGKLSDSGKTVPVAYSASSTSPRAARETRITWENGVPTEASVVPPRSSSPDPATQGGTLDPVSAGFALLRDAPTDRICKTTIDIFDGSRRNRIALGQPKEEDGEIICTGEYTRLEGEENTFSVKDEYSFRVVFRPLGNGNARFQRLETRTSFGNAVLERL